MIIRANIKVIIDWLEFHISDSSWRSEWTRDPVEPMVDPDNFSQCLACGQGWKVINPVCNGWEIIIDDKDLEILFGLKFL